eukprot:scaffold114358_cov14-Tisochrysis_lutea.AAC.1
MHQFSVLRPLNFLLKARKEGLASTATFFIAGLQPGSMAQRGQVGMDVIDDQLYNGFLVIAAQLYKGFRAGPAFLSCGVRNRMQASKSDGLVTSANWVGWR